MSEDSDFSFIMDEVQPAMAEVVPSLYSELRQLADAHFLRERGDHTLQPTALVHETYVRLSEQLGSGIENRNHFFGIASRLMRQILVDHARKKKSAKRGGDFARVSISDSAVAGVESEIDILDLEEALSKLTAMNHDYGRLVELRFFAGLTSEEAGDVMGISRAEVARRWRVIRAWLKDELNGSQSA